MSPKKTKEKAATKFRAWVREYVNDSPEFKAPEVTQAAIDHFKKNDKKTWRALVAEQEYRLAYDLVLRVVGAGRVVFGNGSVVSDRASLSDVIAEQSRSVFANWYEYVGDRHIDLKALTKDTIKLAIADRVGTIEEEERKVSFLRSLERGLRGRKTVGEAYTEDELLRKAKEAGLIVDDGPDEGDADQTREAA